MNTIVGKANTDRWRSTTLVLLALGALGVSAPTAWTADVEVFGASADGTITDSDVDGAPDYADWTFDLSGHEGAITRTTETPASSLERRVVFEYDISGMTTEPPLIATLRFNIRGAAVYPMDPTVIHVYVYSANLVEGTDDYLSQPAWLGDSVTVEPFQPTTAVELNVSRAVELALRDGATALGIRFQVDPNTTSDKAQAFIDALDAEPATKPSLEVTDDPLRVNVIRVRKQIRP